MSESFNKIISLSEFNADLIAAHFQVPPHRPYELNAMRFMFRMYSDELPKTGNRCTHTKIVAEAVIEKIEFRYDLYKHFVDDFFKLSARYDHKAIAHAVICDGYTTQANEEHRTHNDYQVEETILKACNIRDDALLLESAGMPEDISIIEPESIFLAHIHAIENLKELEESLEDHSIQELQKYFLKEFPVIRSFIMPDTLIGKKLEEFLDHMSAEIMTMLQPLKQLEYKPQRPALRIVVNNGPAP